MCAYPPCDLPRIGFCTRCLLVGWCSVAHQKAHWKAGHKAVCAPAETRLVPVLSWEQCVMAKAKAAAPPSLAATAKLAPIPAWDITRDGAPPTAILKAWRKAAEGGACGGSVRARLLLRFWYRCCPGLQARRRVAREGGGAGLRRRPEQPRRLLPARRGCCPGLLACRRVVRQGGGAGSRQRPAQPRLLLRSRQGCRTGLQACRRVVREGSCAGQRRSRHTLRRLPCYAHDDCQRCGARLSTPRAWHAYVQRAMRRFNH